MAAFLDVCRFNPAAGGTTDWTYSSAATGYQGPSAAGVVNGRLYKYRAESADLSQWELGEGTYNTGTGMLARTTILYNSSGTGTGAGQSGAGTKINFSTVPQVAIVALKEDLISVEETNSFSTTQQTQARTNIGADFPSGTVMLFYQASAPLNWTKITTQNDKAIRVVSGSGGVSGGSNAFSTVMAQTVVGGTTLSAAQIPSHSHGIAAPVIWGTYSGATPTYLAGTNTPANSGTANPAYFPANTDGGAVGGGAHNHSITLSIQYIDVILASKN